MQQWKQEIVSRIGCTGMSEDLFNQCWDALTKEEQTKLTSGKTLDRQFVRAILSSSGMCVPFVPSPQKHVEDWQSCAALCEFGNKDYIGALRPEHAAIYRDHKQNMSPMEVRAANRALISTLFSAFPRDVVLAILYGYTELVTEDLCPQWPDSLSQRCGVVAKWWKLWWSTDAMCVDKFRGEYACFSNFYATKPIMFEGRPYYCVESAFQAAKTLDAEERARFEQLDGSKSKRLGRSVHLRFDWERAKYWVMYQCLCQKFNYGTDCREILDSTCGMSLIEGNTWHDNIWGDCKCERCASKPGKNMLGKTLMYIRDHDFSFHAAMVSGKPDAKGFILPIEWRPWLNSRMLEMLARAGKYKVCVHMTIPHALTLVDGVYHESLDGDMHSEYLYFPETEACLPL